MSCQTPQNKNVTHISPTELHQKINDNIQLIDVRTPKEYALAHISNAENINFFDEDFFEKINKLDKETPVFIYCRSGKRSNKSIKEFQNAGFTKIYNLKGGFLNWKSKGL